jgi:hypothetical protein
MPQTQPTAACGNLKRLALRAMETPHELRQERPSAFVAPGGLLVVAGLESDCWDLRPPRRGNWEYVAGVRLLCTRPRVRRPALTRRALGVHRPPDRSFDGASATVVRARAFVF